MVEDRIAALEAHAATLESRLRRLEGAGAWDPSRPEAPAAREARAGAAASRGAIAPRGAAAPRRRAARTARDLEEFLGGNVLAWVGGVAVLAGLAFLLTIAISRGWLGEGARTVLAGGLSLALLGAGTWLREHRDRTQAAVAAAAVGVAGCFGTLIVAGPVYGLVPQSLALAGAFATGAVAAALGGRWNVQVIGWLGLLGALLAPATLDAFDRSGLAFLVIAYAATIAVLVRQRWTALAVTAFAVTTLEWLWWLYVEQPAAGDATLALAGFGALTAALALGLEANRRGLHPVAIGPAAHPRTSAAAVALLVLDAGLLALVGWDVVPRNELWLATLAAAHVVLGLTGARASRVSRELALILLAAAIVLAN
ncbi:MAG TPA: DUF2339 domain-containing protein, partial [Solirubrobacter sp.]|nr:DUF2339 domain-containing protein [Solirubrobacter sp.]